MNEFKFSCPNCQQNIQATPEYTGVQINCPNCQAAIIVPEATAANVPKPGKLTKAPSTVHHAATNPVMAAATVRKAKKPRTGLYVGLGVGIVVGVAAIIAAPKLVEKYQQHKDAVAAEQAATNALPPPPPDLAADEILKNVGATYKGLTSYSAHGESVGNIDMSLVNPTLKAPLHPTAKLSVLLSRPNLYRMEWERQAGQKTIKGAVWSSGKGDFVRTGTTPLKAKNREAAFTMAGGASGTLGVALVELFFDETNSLAVALKHYSKTNNETLHGRKCYVLTGQIGFQKLLFWIHKDDFLIAQTEVVLGGKMDDSMMAGLTAAQKAQVQILTKMKGNIIEAYQDIETNKALNPDAFQTALR